MKYTFLIILVMALLLAICYNIISNLKNEIDEMEKQLSVEKSNNNNLMAEIERRNANVIILSRKIESLEKVLDDNHNWAYEPVPDDVVKRLSE